MGGKALTDDDYVVSSDEKTSTQARPVATRASHPRRAATCGSSSSTSGGRAPLPGHLGRAPGQDLGRCEEKTGIVPFGRLVSQVMTTEPYKSARRVFWLVDNVPRGAG